MYFLRTSGEGPPALEPQSFFEMMMGMTEAEWDTLGDDDAEASVEPKDRQPR